jgi:SAM-dependent methyltransferase
VLNDLRRPSRQRAARRIAEEPEAQQFQRFSRLNDKEWRRTLFDSIDGVAALPMPGFPPPDMQAAFMGTSNELAVGEAWDFYQLMAAQRRKYRFSLGANSHILDFGCGWGRISRMFLHDVPASHIWGADPLPRAIDICRNTKVPGQIVPLQQMPPCELPSAQFDTAFAFSVFSHLSPKAHVAWEAEFARFLKPGGLAFITTQPQWFLDRCRRLREHPEERSSQWHEMIASSFVDYEGSNARYEAGEFLFAPTGGGALLEEFYGEAVVPRGYFESQWGSHFELLDFIADASICPQALAVLRRRV